MKIKRIIALFLVLLLSQPCWTYAVEDTFSDGEVTAFNHMTGLLKSVNVLEQDSGRVMASTISKGDFLMLAARLVSGGDLAITSESYMDYAPMFGVDKEELTLTQQNEATYEYAVGTLLHGLGYSNLQSVMGDIQTTAMQLGLLDQINYRENVSITYAQVIQLFENALYTPVVEYTSDNTQHLNGSEQGTLLYRTFGLEKRTGIVTATEKTPLQGNTPLPKGQIEIDNVVYDIIVEDDVYSGLLGQSVEFYASVDKDELVYLYASENRNNILILPGEQIHSYEAKTYLYSQSDRDRLSKARLAPVFYIIYNGFAASDLYQTQMVPQLGTVVLIDNNNDGEYEVAVIDDYTPGEIKFVDYQKEMLYLETTAGTQKLSLGDYETVDICKHGGSASSIDTLKSGDMVMTAASRAGKRVYIGKLGEIVSGEVTEVSFNGETVESVMVNGETLSVASGCYGGPVETKKTYQFYLDNGTIVAISEPQSGAETYGYLVDVRRQNGLSETLKLKIYSEDGVMLQLNTAEKISIDGLLGQYAEDVYPRLYDIEAQKAKSQLIQYTLNASGEVNYINTAYNYAPGYKDILPENGESETSLRVMFSSTLDNEGSVYYYDLLGAFTGGKVAVSPGAICFQIPSNPQDAEVSEFAVSKPHNLHKTNSGYSLDAYADTESNLQANILVVTDGGVNDRENYIGVIRSITSVLDNEGQPALRMIIDGPDGVNIDVYNRDFTGLIKPYYNDAAEAIYPFEVGDIIHCFYSGNRLYGLSMVYDHSENILTYPDNREYGGWQKYTLGPVYEKDGSMVKISRDDNTVITGEPTNYEIYDIAGFRVDLVTTIRGDKQVISADYNQIVDYLSSPDNYSRLFVYTSEGYPWLCVIYE